MTNLRSPSVILFFFVALSSLFTVNSYLIGVDIGSEFFKICLIKPGKPFSIVENLQSKLKTPTAISLKDDEITYGAEAIGKKARFPKNIFTFFEDYLGEKYNSTFVNEFLHDFLVSYDIVEDTERNAINFNIQFNKKVETLSVEEIYALLFNHIKFISEKYAGIAITNIYLTIPSFFNYKQRQALAQAVEISKLHLDGFVSENLAAVVYYQFKKIFEDEQYFIFYNMGSSYTQASLVSIKTLYETKNNKTVDIGNEVKVLGETWNRKLGGHRFDSNLVHLMMDKFDKLPERQGKPSVSENKKVFEKLIPHSIKYKEILSANKETHIAVLGVDSGLNLEGPLSREEFNNANKELFDQVYEPIDKLLKQSNLTLDNITQIELIGGSIRIPGVQEELKEKLGNYSNLLGTHMNGDDSMAYGTAFVAANATKNFKGSRRAFMSVGANSEIKIYLNNYNVTEETVFCEDDDLKTAKLNTNCEHRLNKTRVMFPLRSNFNTKKAARIPHDGELSIKLTEKMVDEDDERELMTYYITGVKDLIAQMEQENFTSIPKIKLEFDYSRGGQVSVEATAEYDEDLYLNLITDEQGKEELRYLRNVSEKLPQETLDEIDMILNVSKVVTDYEYKKMMSSNKTANGTSNETLNDTTLNSTSNDTATNMSNIISESDKKFLLKKKLVGEKKVHTIKHPLKVNVTYTYPKPLSEEKIIELRHNIQRLIEIDENRIKMIEKRNAIESLLYNRKEWLSSESAERYSTKDELADTLAYLENISNWYDEDGFDANLTVLDKEIRNITGYFSKFEKRQKIDYERYEEVTKIITELNKTNITANDLVKRDPWRFEHFNNTFLKDINAVEKWLIESLEKQNNRSLTEEPYLLAEHIKDKRRIITNSLYKLKQVKKPKEPEKPNIDDIMKDGVNLEDLMKNSNFTKEEWEKLKESMNNETNSNNSTEQNKTEEQNAEDQTKGDL